MPNGNALLQAYSGGAVGWDTRPFMQHFAQLQAKQAAKRDALDKYYTEQVASITPTGVRDQDLRDMKNPDGSVTPGWMTKFNEFKTYGIANKAKLLKGDYEAISNFNRMKNELVAGQELSKRAADKDKMGFDYRTKNDHVTDDDLNILNDNSKSIYDPTRQNLDLAGLSFGKAPLDVHKWLPTIQGNYKRGTIQASPDIVDDKKGLRTATTHDIYSPENIKAMADMGAADVIAKGKNSAEWNYFDKIYHSDQLPLLQDAFSKIYPQGGVIDSPAKAAAAYTILQNSQPTNISTKTTEYESPEMADRRKRDFARFQLGLDKQKEQFKADLKGKSEGAAQSIIAKRLNTMADAARDAARAGGANVKTFQNVPGYGSVSGFKIENDPILLKSLEITDEWGSKVGPSEVYYNRNKGIFLPVYPDAEVITNPQTKEMSFTGRQKTANGKISTSKTTGLKFETVVANYASEALSPKLAAESYVDQDEDSNAGGGGASTTPKAPGRAVKSTKTNNPLPFTWKK